MLITATDRDVRLSGFGRARIWEATKSEAGVAHAQWSKPSEGFSPNLTNLAFLPPEIITIWKDCLDKAASAVGSEANAKSQENDNETEAATRAIAEGQFDKVIAEHVGLTAGLAWDVYVLYVFGALQPIIVAIDVQISHPRNHLNKFVACRRLPRYSYAIICSIVLTGRLPYDDHVSCFELCALSGPPLPPPRRPPAPPRPRLACVNAS